MPRRLLIWWVMLWALAPGIALADAAPFDLAGSTLQVSVAHAGLTLPIAEVPNLAPGDRISLKAVFPPGQTVHYLLVTAFLQGATNPPPPTWFFRAETWTRKGRDGMAIVVPTGAQQVVVFLAPQTGGDFKTLMDTVRGKPGAFVRASQDLNQAMLDRARLDVFLDALRKSSPGDAGRLKGESSLLARSLMLKLNDDCFAKTPELQAACLMQNRESMVLDDGHSTSLVEGLTSGNAADLAMQLSASPQAGFGYYSPYIAAVMDIARLTESFRSAHYQYIPALATLHGDQISLLLNAAPSFHDPLSVLMTALPAVEAPQAPPLRPLEPDAAYCARSTDLALPVDGAPLVYATDYAHDLVLKAKGKDGRTIELPVRADANRGGLIADTRGVAADALGDAFDASLEGQWGFQPFNGPTFHLVAPHAEAWRVVDADQQALIVGRDDKVRLTGQWAPCVDTVTMQQADGEPRPLDWTAVGRDQLAVTIPLHDAAPGPITLLVRQHGVADPQSVTVQAYAQAGRLDGLTLHAGDSVGVLKGNRLDQVDGLTIRGVEFRPDALHSSGGTDELSVVTAEAGGLAVLKPGQGVTARVKLKDGRTVALKATIAPARPRVSLIAKSVHTEAASTAAEPIAIQLTDADELPQNARLTFSVRAETPARFTSDETIEVTGADLAHSVTLTAASGLALADDQVMVATLDAKVLGASTFGPLQFRIVSGAGAGDWQPLATLVRLPDLHGFRCERGTAQPCELSGASLFLIDAIARDPAFTNPAQPPEGFTGSSLSVPHPEGGRLYIKLRDDPAAENILTVPTIRTAGAGKR